MRNVKVPRTVQAHRGGVERTPPAVVVKIRNAARYAFGYLPDIDVPPPDAPMDFCAWFEVYLDGAWWTFDARNNTRRRGRAVIARPPERLLELLDS